MAPDQLAGALDTLKPKLVPTPEQEAIIRAAREDTRSILVRAYAGCAKTTTLEMIAHALPPTPALALAFNVKIKTELEKRFPSTFTIKTMNGLGHSAWQQALGRRLTLDEKKLGKIITQILRDARYEASQDDWAVVRQLASSAMAMGLVPSKFPQKGLVPDNEAFWEELSTNFLGTHEKALCSFAREAIIEDIKQGFAGIISFDDQIYLSTLFGGQYPRYPLVMVDESQDLSPLNHLQIKKVAADRLIVVGDEKQAIYAFRGADTESISKLRSLRPEWIELPLATTFRCPRVIVARQAEHVPEFRAHHSNPDGHFADWQAQEGQEPAQAAWNQGKLFSLGHHSIAVLCRNNAPLLSLAFKLLRRQCGVQMLGRDIGKGLVLLSKKILPDDALAAEACATAIRQWAIHESDLARANNKDEKLEGIEDRSEALLAVLEGSEAENAGALRVRLSDLFSRDSGRITLSTGHRAKGLEWDLVLHLDPWRVPSKWAKRAGANGDERALQQEWNLNYVIETRAKRALILANLQDFA